MANPTLEFCDKLRDYFGKQNITIHSWGKTNRGKNVFELGSTNQSILLYIKFSKIEWKQNDDFEYGFWGLNTEILRELQKSKQKWFVVLLHGNEFVEQDGYILNSKYFTKAKQNWTIGGRKEYKIHRKDIEDSSFFRGLEDFNQRLFYPASQMKLLNEIKYDPNGLVPAIAQDDATGDILMLAWMNRESLEETVKTNRAVYWSRSRGKLWRKGEESGNVQEVKSIHVDCDADVVLLRVHQVGDAACHTGHRTCFYREVIDGGDGFNEKNDIVFDPKTVYKR